MKEHEIRKKEKNCELNYDIKYIKENYDYNMTQEKLNSQLDYDIKKDINCVKSAIKR